VVPAVNRKDDGENHDRQDEIGKRPGHHDGGTAADRLVEKALPALLGRHAFDFALVGNAGGVFIPKKFDVAAERDGGNFPAGAVPVVEAGELGPETQRKRQHPYATPARDEEMAELMKENDDTEAEQEWDDPTRESATPKREIAENVHSGPVPRPLLSAPTDSLERLCGYFRQ